MRRVPNTLRTIVACVFASMASHAAATPFTFDDIEFWIGTGANRAAIAIDWFENSTDPPALVWGYRWDGMATGRDMLMAVVAADERLFAKFGNTQANPVRLYGIGYDVDADGDFGACRTFGDELDCTEFDEAGFAYSGEIFIAATATDAGDLYREGWAFGTGFWHYGVPATPGTNPYDGGAWMDIQEGMATRQLVDGDWDSWAFQLSTIPPFTSYAENPVAAPSPYPPGDYNRDRRVDLDDYAMWKSEYGSTTNPAADGNRDGRVDAGDYVVWRNNLGAGVPATGSGVPEPQSLRLAACIACLLATLRRGKERS